MLFPDIPVWYSWLAKYSQAVENLYYDCLIGGPWLKKTTLQDNFRAQWAYNISKRIDCLVETKDEVWIVEVSASPGLRAVGQLLCYWALWQEDPKINKPEKMVLVCSAVDRDLLACAAKYGIITYVMPVQEASR